MANRTEVLKECRAETAKVVCDLERLGLTVRRSWPEVYEGWDFVLENGTTLFPLNYEATSVLRNLTGFAVFTSDHYDRKLRVNTQGKEYERSV